ncbi:MAG: hypothetical protein WC137_00350 [Alphaproteobacteria bacterium]
MIEMLSDHNPYDYDSLDSLRRPNFLKWNGGIDLWQSGLPSVDVLLVDTDKKSEIITALEKFMDKNKDIGCGNACVRFDHPKLPPNRDGISGIIRTDFTRITDIILSAKQEGWTPSVWIYGTNRDTASTICAMSFINDGLVIDFLPSGFEMQELSKGLVVPSAVVKTKSFAPPCEICWKIRSCI